MHLAAGDEQALERTPRCEFKFAWDDSYGSGRHVLQRQPDTTGTSNLGGLSFIST